MKEIKREEGVTSGVKGTAIASHTELVLLLNIWTEGSMAAAADE